MNAGLGKKLTIANKNKSEVDNEKFSFKKKKLGNIK
jgi:hypothetical protein